MIITGSLPAVAASLLEPILRRASHSDWRRPPQFHLAHPLSYHRRRVPDQMVFHPVLPLAVPRLSVHKRAHAASAPLGAYRGPEAQRLLAVYQHTLHQLLNGTESTHA